MYLYLYAETVDNPVRLLIHARVAGQPSSSPSILSVTNEYKYGSIRVTFVSSSKIARACTRVQFLNNFQISCTFYNNGQILLENTQKHEFITVIRTE